MTYWLDRKRGTLARAQQLGAEGLPLDGQEEVPDDHPEAVAILNPPPLPPPRDLLAEKVAVLEAKVAALEAKPVTEVAR